MSEYSIKLKAELKNEFWRGFSMGMMTTIGILFFSVEVARL